MTAVAILPARGGSRRIPRKNIALFHGRPMISYPIQTAKESGLFDLGIYVSSEDDEILDLALELGVEPLSRDTSMARDEVGTQELMAYHLNGNLDLVTRKVDCVCCIYPCTPMMTAAQLRFGFNLIADPPMIAPPETYAYIPGWFYWGKTELFLNGIPLPVSGSIKIPDNYIDINTPEDWAKAEEMYKAYTALRKPAEQWTEEETREFMKGSQP